MGPTLWKLHITISSIKLLTFLLKLNFKDLPMTVLLVRSQNRDYLQVIINNILQQIADWAENKKLKINYQKCFCLVIGRKGPLKRSLTININGNHIKSVKKLKYLGILLDQRLNWTPHIQFICDKAKKVFHVLRAVSGNSWGFNPMTQNNVHCCYCPNSYLWCCNLGGGRP